MKLRIGRFSYSNLFPIFYMLDHECDCSSYEFIEGVPSELNRMLHEGSIDISPSSSIEYLKNPSLYDIIENHSISSNGPVESILLFSRRPITELGGSSVMMTYQSDTSVSMLQIILSKFYNLSCRYTRTAEPIGKVIHEADAYLLIGDDALKESGNWPELYIYDLGLLWTRHTGLPFTYALWLKRKDVEAAKKPLVSQFVLDLDYAKTAALGNMSFLASVSPLNRILSDKNLIRYWQGISYDYSEDHRKGLDLFRAYASELNLLI